VAGAGDRGFSTYSGLVGNDLERCSETEIHITRRGHQVEFEFTRHATRSRLPNATFLKERPVITDHAAPHLRCLPPQCS
jgi:hypothetical protein